MRKQEQPEVRWTPGAPVVTGQVVIRAERAGDLVAPVEQPVTPTAA